ncbi:MAG: hypothetical protein JWM33_3433, partial [Caulobacteraceae bacterium]|nr:hypothetical protein [Caulobacteraceae bacterium]
LAQAAAYRGFIAQGGSISANFADGDAVSRGMVAGSAYEQNQFMEGMIAYGAVAALSDPAFMAGVREFGGDPAQRAQIVAAIIADPAYAVSFKGSDTAAGLVIAALRQDGQKLYDAGAKVFQASYDLQLTAPWSKRDATSPAQRLSDAKTAAQRAVTGDAAESARLSQAANVGGPLGIAAPAVAPPYSQAVIRALAVAALAALGEAGDERYDQIKPMLIDSVTPFCLNLAKLDVNQCLAAAKPWYEVVYCMGKAELVETGQCVISATGDSRPADPLPVFAARAATPATRAATPAARGATPAARAPTPATRR